jgi:hypothetical protein
MQEVVRSCTDLKEQENQRGWSVRADRPEFCLAPLPGTWPGDSPWPRPLAAPSPACGPAALRPSRHRVGGAPVSGAPRPWAPGGRGSATGRT